jgi:hypothetical protein
MELELVQLQAETHIRELEEMIQLLLERSMYEDYYAEGLEKISRYQGRVAEQRQLAVLVDGMKADCWARAVLIKAFSAAIIADLVKPLRILLKQQREIAKELRTNINTEQKRVNSYEKALELAQTSYKEQFRKAEHVVFRAEQEQQYEKRQEIQAMNETLKEVLSHYKEALERYNQHLPRHQQAVADVLERYREGEATRLREMGKSLRKMQTMLIECGENTRKVAEQQSELYAKCEDMWDIGSFAADISLNVTPHLFEPYIGSHPSFLDLADQIPTLSYANCLSEQPVEAKGRMEKLVTQAWSDVLGSKNLQVFRDMVREQWGRKLWISTLNVRRAQGLFRLDYTGFCSIAELMNVVLDECETASDISTAKSCIILSQTFYTLPKAEKQFLQAKIVAHTLWRQPETWDSIVQDGIDKELAKQKAYGCTGQAADQKSTVFGQLSSYVHVMSLFDVDVLVIKAVLGRFCAVYAFEEEEMGMLLEISSSSQSCRSLSMDVVSLKDSPAPRSESYAEDSPK